MERRRRWSDDEKARILEETLAPGARVSDVARRNDVAMSVLFTWRRKARVPATAVAPFVPVNIVEAPAVSPPIVRPPISRASKGTRGLIEIDLGSGRRLKVDADVDADALSRVLDVLDRR
ncbi:MAG: transposase [Candidatus Eremiobacteraeota bacterium]|nr:transposase [Candidatus Eremiobacteraeota bacterium]